MLRNERELLKGFDVGATVGSASADFVSADKWLPRDYYQNGQGEKCLPSVRPSLQQMVPVLLAGTPRMYISNSPADASGGGGSTKEKGFDALKFHKTMIKEIAKAAAAGAAAGAAGGVVRGAVVGPGGAAAGAALGAAGGAASGYVLGAIKGATIVIEEQLEKSPSVSDGCRGRGCWQ